MREILFRARTVSESEYLDDGEWVEGFYTCFNGEEHRIYTGYSETDCGDYYPDWFNVLPETVEQYTGLTDKNGKKIFEGDVCRNTRTGEFVSVKWHGTMAGFVWSKRKESTHLYNFGELFRAYDKFEIIGNIHDNPELLNGMESEDE